MDLQHLTSDYYESNSQYNGKSIRVINSDRNSYDTYLSCYYNNDNNYYLILEKYIQTIPTSSADRISI